MSVRAVCAEIGSFLTAACCAGCDLPGTHLCPRCVGQIASLTPNRRTLVGVPLVCAFPFEEVPARCIRQVKERGSTHLLGAMLPAFTAALEDVLATYPNAVCVPIPTSYRSFLRRGFRVPELLIRGAGFRSTRMLRITRIVRDQRSLGRVARAANVRASLAIRPAAWRPSALIVDDVITTGATIAEAIRALRDGGVGVVGAVTLAATAQQR